MVRQFGYSMMVAVPLALVVVVSVNLLEPPEAIIWIAFSVYVVLSLLGGDILEQRALRRERTGGHTPFQT